MTNTGKLTKKEVKRLVEAFGLQRLKSQTITKELNEQVNYILWDNVDGIQEDGFQAMTRQMNDDVKDLIGDFIDAHDYDGFFEAVECLDPALFQEVERQVNKQFDDVLDDGAKGIVKEMNNSIKGEPGFRRNYDDFQLMVIDTFWKEEGKAKFEDLMKSLGDKVNTLRGVKGIEKLAPSIHDDRSCDYQTQKIVKELCWAKGRTL